MTQVHFFVDAGPSYGFGHLRRCLTLALELKQYGMEATFYSGDSVPELVSVFRWRRSDYTTWPKEIALSKRLLDVAVVDSYYIDQGFMDYVRDRAAVVVQMNDFGAPLAGSDIVVNPVVIENGSRGRNRARYLEGPRYALLRREFRDIRPRYIGEAVRTVLITLGGAARRKQYETVIRGLRNVARRMRMNGSLRTPFQARIVVGPFSERPRLSTSDEVIMPVLLVNPDMAREMQSADVAISAGGQTLFELLACGTPSGVIQVADNQTNNIEYFASKGAVLRGGDVRKPHWEDSFQEAVYALLTDRALRQSLSEVGQNLVDGCGASRVAEVIWTTRMRLLNGIAGSEECNV